MLKTFMLAILLTLVAFSARAQEMGSPGEPLLLDPIIFFQVGKPQLVEDPSWKYGVCLEWKKAPEAVAYQVNEEINGQFSREDPYLTTNKYCRYHRFGTTVRVRVLPIYPPWLPGIWSPPSDPLKFEPLIRE